MSDNSFDSWNDILNYIKNKLIAKGFTKPTVVDIPIGKYVYDAFDWVDITEIDSTIEVITDDLDEYYNNQFYSELHKTKIATELGNRLNNIDEYIGVFFIATLWRSIYYRYSKLDNKYKPVALNMVNMAKESINFYDLPKNRSYFLPTNNYMDRLEVNLYDDDCKFLDAFIDYFIDVHKNNALMRYVTTVDCFERKIAIKIPGGKLEVSLTKVDGEYIQAATVFYSEEGSPLDLTLVEIKEGELAKQQCYNPDDNHIIDVYTYECIHTEDWTHTFSVDTDKFKELIGEK